MQSEPYSNDSIVGVENALISVYDVKKSGFLEIWLLLCDDCARHTGINNVLGLRVRRQRNVMAPHLSSPD